MTIYLYGWFLWFFICTITLLGVSRLKVLLIFLILSVSFIPILRGNVGTDTVPVYEPIATHPFLYTGLAPVYILLNQIFKFLLSVPHEVIQAIAFLFVFLLLLFVISAKKNELSIILYFFFPVYFYEYSLNMLRIGLACIFLLFFFRYANKRCSFKRFLVIILSFLIQYSVLIPILYIFYQVDGFKLKKLIYLGLLTSSVLLCFIAFDNSYLLAKYKLYVLSDFVAPSIFSGMSNVLVSMIVLFGFFLENSKSRMAVKMILYSLFFIVLSWIISRYTYAGLRLLDLVEFSIPFSIMVYYEKRSLIFGRTFVLSLFCAGLVGAVFVFRDIIVANSLLKNTIYVGSPFIPYKFYWQMANG